MVGCRCFAGVVISVVIGLGVHRLVNLEKDDRKLHVQPIGGINLGEIADKARKLFGVKKLDLRVKLR
eukprot:1194642-Prorocentrum_minimum.AAC.6